MRHGLAVALLTVTVLLAFDPPELTLTFDPEMPMPADPEAVVAQEACRMLAVQRVPLPVPFTLVWLRRAQEGAALILDPASPRVHGLLSRCPPA